MGSVLPRMHDMLRILLWENIPVDHGISVLRVQKLYLCSFLGYANVGKRRQVLMSFVAMISRA